MVLKRKMQTGGQTTKKPPVGVPTTEEKVESLLSELSKQVAIALKENEVQDVMIEELKLSTNNPLNG